MQNLLEGNFLCLQLPVPHYCRACRMENKSEKMYNSWCKHASFTFAVCRFIWSKYCLMWKIRPCTLSLLQSAEQGFWLTLPGLVEIVSYPPPPPLFCPPPIRCSKFIPAAVLQLVDTNYPNKFAEVLYSHNYGYEAPVDKVNIIMLYCIRA